MTFTRILAACTLLMLVACGGGTSTKPVISPGSTPAAKTELVTITIQTKGATSIERRARYISPNAKSVAIGVSPGDPQYPPTSSCVNIVSSITSYTLQVAAAIGNDNFLIQTYDNVCASNGTATGFAIGSTKGISGTVTPGAANVLNPNGVAPAQPCTGSCTMTIGAIFNFVNSVFSASLSTTTPGLTTFAMDPGVTMALPINFTLNGNAGTPLTSPDANGSPVPLLQPVTITLTDTSPKAVPQTIGLALVNAAGYIYCPQINGASVQFAAAATPTCPQNRTTAGTIAFGSGVAVQVTFASAPRAMDQLVLVYNGASQSFFQSATLVATAGPTLGSIPIGAQPQVTSLAPVLPVASTGIAFAPGGGVQLITAATQVYTVTAPATIGAGSTPAAGTNLTGITALNAVVASSYAVDTNCVACDATHLGIYQLGTTPATVNGQAPAQLTTVPGVSALALDQSGPIGIVGLSPGQGGAASYGSLVVAANNSLYRLDLASPNTVSAITLMAGSGIAGTAGQGFLDNAAGPSARMNFATATFTGLALNAVGSAVVFADPGNSALRQVSLAPGNAASTLATYSAPPVGVAVDPTSGVIITTHPSVNALVSVSSTGAAGAVFAGQPGQSGAQDGLGIQGYPLQFNPGNRAAGPSGPTIPGPQYAGLYEPAGLTPIGPNSAQAAQAVAGLAAYIARFASPQGIAVDPSSTPNARFSVVDRAARALRIVL